MNECEHENAEFHSFQPDRIDEPGCSAHWHCPDCDECFPEEWGYTDD